MMHLKVTQQELFLMIDTHDPFQSPPTIREPLSMAESIDLWGFELSEPFDANVGFWMEGK